MSLVIYLAIPIFILTMVVELLWARYARKMGREVAGYEVKDTAASLAMGIGDLVVAAVTKLGTLPILIWLYSHRICTAPEGVVGYLILFVVEDFCYYWFHRTSHSIRLFWASHVNHHSSQYYNLSTALRQSWTESLFTPPFWWPMAILGFRPELILLQQAVSLLYQYWIHTEAIRTMGPLEWVLNTPSHHRVHHGSDVPYLDRNHGGILIIWDRLFGTFEQETSRPHYGLTKNIETFNPFRIASHEFASIFKDVRSARSFRSAVGYAFGPPGWSDDGRSMTADQMRAAAKVG